MCCSLTLLSQTDDLLIIEASFDSISNKLWVGAKNQCGYPATALYRIQGAERCPVD